VKTVEVVGVRDKMERERKRICFRSCHFQLIMRDVKVYMVVSCDGIWRQ
jgi:hypothetical protein